MLIFISFSGCLILSVFAKNVFTLYITIGLGTGFGFGMIYLPAIVSVTMYFEKLRSLATGIAVCGSGFGTVVFAPLTNYLIVNYKWQGALLVIAGIVFFCSIFGYMFKPLSLEEVEAEPTKVIGNNNNNNNNNNVKYNSADRDFANQSLLSPNNNNHQQIIRSHSIGNDMIKNGGTNGNALKVNDEKSRLAMSLSQPLLNDPKDSNMTNRSMRSAVSGTLNRPDAFYTGSLHNIAKHRSSTSVHSGGDRYGSLRRRSENQEIDDKLEVCGCIPCSKETHETITQMMSFSLLKDPVFILFTVSNFLTR